MWIDVGMPDAERLHRASKLADRVAIYTHRNPDVLKQQLAGKRIHQLEANFLNPKIIGDAAKIHPVLVVFSLLVGEHFFQIKGALFAVPCLSIVQTIFLHFRETTMGLSDPMATQPPEPLFGAGDRKEP